MEKVHPEGVVQEWEEVLGWVGLEEEGWVAQEMGGSRSGAGPAGECVCPECGTLVPHEAGIPCSFNQCPKCGAKMVRK